VTSNDPRTARTEAGLEAAAHAADSSPDALLVLDREGRLTYANDALGRMLGAAPADLLGKTADDAVELRDAEGNGWWRCSEKLRGMRAVRGVPARPLTLVTGTTERLVDLAATFERGPDGKVTRTVVALRDAAARRRAETAQSELISTLAHELRSPLTSVKGFSATMLARWERFSDEQKLHMLTTINADADRVTRLIKELLDVSRIDAGRLEINRRMIELPLIARGIGERLQVNDGSRDLAIRFPDDFPDVYADGDKIEQVLLNLVENAVRYTDEGTVEITGTATAGAVEVGVRDNGPGIAADKLPQLFTKFSKLRDHPGATTGTGLGLYISKGIVEAHGGRMWAESEPGAGTVIRFRLPRGGLELAGIE
jgi:PAS domain S-box-containing protein